MGKVGNTKSGWRGGILSKGCHNILRGCYKVCFGLRGLFYIYIYTPIKVFQIRHKRKVKVLFVLSELPLWKTEWLYRRMLACERFSPILGLTASAEYQKQVAESAKVRLAEYCRAKGYDFYDVDDNVADCKSAFATDIIFYQKPYDLVYNKSMVYHKHLSALFCYALYGFHSVVVDWQIRLPLFKYAWQNYFENELAARPLRVMRDFKRDNLVITGLPMSDALLRPKSEYADPWKQLGKRKRIIYAPHCTIAGHSAGVDYSTFLVHAENIFELSQKYKDKVQWAFKPHPLLYSRLLKVWGKEKTENYYSRWRQHENVQFEDGEYAGLFMHSDAMIHDCGSFTIEYHYTGNPVMYLVKGEGHEGNLNEFAKRAFDLHYKGSSLLDIETFIKNVIDGNDPLRNDRRQFFEDYLVPPKGKSASENIIDSILGINGYR